MYGYGNDLLILIYVIDLLNFFLHTMSLLYRLRSHGYWMSYNSFKWLHFQSQPLYRKRKKCQKDKKVKDYKNEKNLWRKKGIVAIQYLFGMTWECIPSWTMCLANLACVYKCMDNESDSHSTVLITRTTPSKSQIQSFSRAWPTPHPARHTRQAPHHTLPAPPLSLFIIYNKKSHTWIIYQIIKPTKARSTPHSSSLNEKKRR